MEDKNIVKMKFSLFEGNDVELKTFQETRPVGRKYIYFGADNDFPQYIWDLYLNSAILSSIIDGTSDYVGGQGVINNLPTNFQSQVNREEQTIEDIIRECSFSYTLMGGFALHLIFDKSGQISEIYNINIQNLRLSEDGETAYYSEKWGKYNTQIVEYPVYTIKNKNKSKKSCIFYFKGHKTRGLYPIPRFIGALTQIRCEAEIGKYHLSNILNNLDSGTIVNFNNGVPSESVKKEIEKKIKEKFGGGANAGKTMVIFNENKDSAATIEKLGEDNKDKKFETLYTNVMKEIFVSMRATPTLFGLQVENNGFSKEEFLQAFELFNKTVISPLQKDIERCFDKIFNMKDSIKLKSFQLEDVENKEIL